MCKEQLGGQVLRNGVMSLLEGYSQLLESALLVIAAIACGWSQSSRLMVFTRVKIDT